MKPRTTAFLCLIASSLSAPATVSIQWEFEALRDSSGTPLTLATTYILVADSGDHGLLPDATDVTGLSLTVGHTFGEGTIFFAGTTSGSVAQDGVTTLEMSDYDVGAGDIWSIYWFPGISAANQTVRAGQSFGSFQSSVLDPVAVGLGATMAMVFPADGAALVSTQFYDSATEHTHAPTPLQFTASQTAAVVPFSWDTNGVTAGAQGGTGNWDTSTTDWRMNSLNSTWANSGTDNDAIFGATAGTVTIAAGGVTANDLTFNTTGYAITGDTLTLNGTTPTVTTAANVTATISSQILGSVGLTKAGDGTLILGGANTYTGTTLVNAGKLAVNGSLTGSAVQVAGGARLGGTGEISDGATTFASGGIHSPGNSVGVETVADVTYSAGSIFEWELGSSPATTGRGTNYDGVNVTGTLTATTGAIFRVVLDGSQTFGNEFWNTPRTWTDIFTTGDGVTAIENWADVFSGGFEYYNYGAGGTLLALGAPSSEGSFTLSESSLSWSPVPEISNALIGGLIGLGLLRRRRNSKIAAPHASEARAR